jgi:cold shock CspA family protein
VQVHWHRPDLFTNAERQAAESRLRVLAAESDDLLEVRIAARPSLHHRRGAQEVAIIGAEPWTDVVVSRLGRDVRTALSEAIDAFERRVRRRRERDRGVRRRAGGRSAEGVVDRVFADDGYGFIVTDGGEVVYFHGSALDSGLQLESLGAGQRVRFDLESGSDGSHATRVAPAVTAASA